LRRLAKREEGFGLVELLIAMTVMVVAIMAIVAAFDSGMVTLNRASRASTAATLADIKMEAFRKMTYASITPTCAAGTSAATDCFSPATPPPAPDGRTYRLDTAVRFDCPVGTLGGTVPSSAACTGAGAARPVKRVTVVVYDPTTTPATELFRATSTFDQATG
jgi:type II secretory pathway pseudopilin PulG